MNKLTLSLVLTIASHIASAQAVKTPTLSTVKIPIIAKPIANPQKTKKINEKDAPAVKRNIKINTGLGGQEGNGGGGVVRNGIHMTFGSAGLWVDAAPQTDSEVPGLPELINTVLEDLPADTQFKSEFSTTLLAGDKRRYYKVKADFFDEEIKKRLIEEYQRAVKVSSENFAIYAVTDTKKQITYLLPEFYLLKPTEQMAILAHEAYWIMFPNTTYEKVIDIEVSMQKFLENKNDFAANLQVMKAFANSPIALYSAAMFYDLKNNIENGFEKTGELEFNVSGKMLFGDNFINCLKERAQDCSFQLKLHWLKLKSTYRDSALINAMADIMSKASYTKLANYRESSQLLLNKFGDIVSDRSSYFKAEGQQIIHYDQIVGYTNSGEVYVTKPIVLYDDLKCTINIGRALTYTNYWDPLHLLDCAVAMEIDTTKPQIRTNAKFVYSNIKFILEK